MEVAVPVATPQQSQSTPAYKGVEAAQDLRKAVVCRYFAFTPTSKKALMVQVSIGDCASARYCTTLKMAAPRLKSQRRTTAACIKAPYFDGTGAHLCPHHAAFLKLSTLLQACTLSCHTHCTKQSQACGTANVSMLLLSTRNQENPSESILTNPIPTEGLTRRIIYARIIIH